MEEQNHDPTVESTSLLATHLIAMEVPDLGATVGDEEDGDLTTSTEG